MADHALTCIYSVSTMELNLCANELKFK